MILYLFNIYLFYNYFRITFLIYIYIDKMIKINDINFTQKTIESIQIDGHDIKEINFEFHGRK